MSNSKTETENNEYHFRGILNTLENGLSSCAQLTPWTKGFLPILPPEDLYSCRIWASTVPLPLWSPTFSPLALPCFPFSFSLPPHFTAVWWHLTLPSSICWQEQVPKQRRLWEMERMPRRAGLCLAGPSCLSLAVLGIGQAQMITQVLSFSHL